MYAGDRLNGGDTSPNPFKAYTTSFDVLDAIVHHFTAAKRNGTLPNLTRIIFVGCVTPQHLAHRLCWVAACGYLCA